MKNQKVAPDLAHQQDSKVVIEDIPMPELRITADDKVRALLTPVIAFSSIGAVGVAYVYGGAASTGHVWAALGPVIGAVLGYYYGKGR